MLKLNISFIIFIFLLFSGNAIAQTNLTPSKNYIFTKTCLDADCIKNTQTVQYSDGLGRPLQEIAIKASPQKNDIVIHYDYDTEGRQAKKYLPIPQANTQNGAFVDNPLANASAVYGNEVINSQKTYDVNFNRVTQIIPTGTDWQQKSVSMGYNTNVDGEVKKYGITTTWVEGRTDSSISLNGTYSANQLMKSSVTDEDGNTTTEFKDGEGKTVLTRKKGGTVNTYYLYNEYGQLVYVIPPLADNIQLTPDNLDKLCYQYRYDGWGRMVEKKIPGKSWEYFVYDKADKLILSRDIKLESQGKWMITKYDTFGRVLYTGIITGGTRASMQSQANAVVIAENKDSSGFTQSGMTVYYTNTSFSGLTLVLSVNYYDTYPNGTPNIPGSIFNQNVLTQDAVNNVVSTKTLPTASYVKNIENDNWTKTYIWYDGKARIIGSQTINHLGGYTRAESDLDFAGTVQQSKVYHKRVSTDVEKLISQSFEYDSQNRLLKHYHTVDNGAPVLLTDNTYTPLSQISNKKVGNALQSIDYSYNIKGWLTQINDPKNLGSQHLFGYALKYNNPEYSTNARFNGNISEVQWKTASADNGTFRVYDYVYDELNRVLKGTYSESMVTNPKNDYYNEEASYDANGNIATLKRFSYPVSGNTPQEIDNLIYEYTNSGNRLTKVRNGASFNNPSGYNAIEGAIAYDDNGNMTKLEDKGISNMAYNFLNLADEITQNNVVTQYLYRADGTKLKKTIQNKETDYLDGFQYENGILQFVPTSEGYYDFTKNSYVYQYKDHLGNVRLSYSKNANNNPEVLEENNFYPFGLKHEGYNILPGNPVYKYQYNGKEQQETGMIDYGWRQYIPELGRWNGIDQLAENYLNISTYAYVGNNPVMMFDVDGRKMIAPTETPQMFAPVGSLWWYYAAGGRYTGHTEADWISMQNGTYGLFNGLGNPFAGGGSSAFGHTKAYRDLMTAFYAGKTGGLISKNGWLRWWTDLGQEDKGNVGTLNFMKLINNSISKISNTADGISYDLMHYQTESFFKDLEKHLNGGVGIASAAIAGQSKLQYLNKIKGLSRFSKVLGRAGVIGTALTAGVTFSEYYNDEWTAHTVVNTVLLAGTLAATVFGAPVVLTGIAIYGIADYTFGIGDKLDSEFGRGSIFWNTHIAN